MAEDGNEEADSVQDSFYESQGDGSLEDAVPPPSASPSTGINEESAGPLSGVDASGCPVCVCAAAPDSESQNTARELLEPMDDGAAKSTMGSDFIENSPERRKRHLLSTGGKSPRSSVCEAAGLGDEGYVHVANRSCCFYQMPWK